MNSKTFAGVAASADRERADERATDAIEQRVKLEKGMSAVWGMDPKMMERARERLPDLF